MCVHVFPELIEKRTCSHLKELQLLLCMFVRLILCCTWVYVMKCYDIINVSKQSRTKSFQLTSLGRRIECSNKLRTSVLGDKRFKYPLKIEKKKTFFPIDSAEDLNFDIF